MLRCLSHRGKLMQTVVSGLGLVLVVGAVGCIYDTTRASPDAAPVRPADAPADRAPDVADQKGIERAPLDKPHVEQSKDLPRDATAQDRPALDTKPPDLGLRCPDGATCPGAPCATGGCYNGYCTLQPVAKDSVVCRQSTSACDPEERCDGSSSNCPANITFKTQTANLYSQAGDDGWVSHDAGGTYAAGYDLVKASLTATTETRGFVSFDTTSLAAAAAMWNVTLTACIEAGSDATLYQVSTASPFPHNFGNDKPLTFDSPVVTPSLTAMPSATPGASVLVSVPANTINPYGPTQFSLRALAVGTSASWASSGTTSGPCLTHPGWTLAVTYCSASP
jgi:hypothetical protein